VTAQAGTPANRSPRRRTILLALVGGLALVTAAVAVAVLRGPTDRTFSAHGITFRYPASWTPIPQATFSSVGNELTRDILGRDPSNAVLIATYRLNSSITDQTFEQLRPEIEDSIRQLVTDGGVMVAGALTRLTVGGMPALRFDLVVPASGGSRLRGTLVVAFAGTTEYWILCRHDEAHGDEFREGCDLIVRTFRTT